MLRASGFPLELSELRMAADPLTSTAKGALVAALVVAGIGRKGRRSDGIGAFLVWRAGQPREAGRGRITSPVLRRSSSLREHLLQRTPQHFSSESLRQFRQDNDGLGSLIVSQALPRELPQFGLVRDCSRTQ